MPDRLLSQVEWVHALLAAICTGLAGHAGAEFVRIIEARFARHLEQQIHEAR